MIKKIILATNLIVKTVVEFIFVCTIGVAIGLIVFIGAFIYKTIKNAINNYNDHSKS
jgi:1,4-dihydroxy-2-naphthoate octaprenyltransferase